MRRPAAARTSPRSPRTRPAAGRPRCRVSGRTRAGARRSRADGRSCRAAAGRRPRCRPAREATTGSPAARAPPPRPAPSRRRSRAGARRERWAGLPQLPPEERLGLLAVAEGEQCPHRVDPVAEPREAVVPVLAAADPAGQRRGRGRKDRPCRHERQQLEHERAAHDLLAPRPGVLSSPGPVHPAGRGPLDVLLHVLARRGSRRGAQRQRRP